MLYKVINNKVIKIVLRKLSGGRIMMEESDVSNPRLAPVEHVVTAPEAEVEDALASYGYRRHVFVTIL